MVTAFFPGLFMFLCRRIEKTPVYLFSKIEKHWNYYQN